MFPSKMRSIVTSNITESKLWDFSIGVASTMAMILLMDIFRGRGAPVPRLTKVGIVVAAALLVSHKWADEWAAHKCDLEVAKEYPPPGCADVISCCLQLARAYLQIGQGARGNVPRHRRRYALLSGISRLG